MVATTAESRNSLDSLAFANSNLIAAVKAVAAFPLALLQHQETNQRRLLLLTYSGQVWISDVHLRPLRLKVLRPLHPLPRVRALGVR